ncbi:DUF995 domain-containing protein [uncultured Roseobacter sp.]|uniref:DUF995 domain-containing protein n=1 Tax=uncultured Roseobacter sp. TaxID=114847 RepID=UPI00263A0E9E|nr:DUF995 domain-containing protein [uncultured Roseobacter sp.]
MIFKTMKGALGAVMTVALMTAGTAALADKKPRGSKPADPQRVIEAYLGNTWNWSRGGSYWGGSGVFQAVWTSEKDDSKSYADGKWYVTSKGTLCYEAVWEWKDKDEPDEVKKNCWRHVVDKEGRLWQRHHEKEEWYKPNPDKITSGNGIEAAYNAHRKAVGG